MAATLAPEGAAVPTGADFLAPQSDRSGRGGRGVNLTNRPTGVNSIRLRSQDFLDFTT